jgi:hypothetical protein
MEQFRLTPAEAKELAEAIDTGMSEMRSVRVVGMEIEEAAEVAEVDGGVVLLTLDVVHGS